jgi:hypothetical protein
LVLVPNQFLSSVLSTGAISLVSNQNGYSPNFLGAWLASLGVRMASIAGFIILPRELGRSRDNYHFLIPATGISEMVQGAKASRAFMLRSKVECVAEAAGDGAWRYNLPPVDEYDVLVLER